MRTALGSYRLDVLLRTDQLQRLVSLVVACTRRPGIAACTAVMGGHSEVAIRTRGWLEAFARGRHAGKPNSVMMRAARDLSPAGELTSQQLLPFEFNSVEMEHDSYRGLQVRLRWGPGFHLGNLSEVAAVWLHL